MSEEIKNIYYSQKTIKKSFPKFFVRLKKNINDNNNNSEVQKYMIKSRNTKPIKRQNFTPFSFNKNNITKSTFYSKLESNSSTKYDNNNNIKYTLTEMSHTYTNKLKNQNNTLLLSSLFKMPDYKRKTINFFLRPKNNSLSIKNKDNMQLNDIQNISNIIYPKMSEEQNNTNILSNNNLDNIDSQIINKTYSINNNLSLNSNYNNNNKISKISTQKQKHDKYSNLAFFLKNRFYSDIEEKFNKQFKGKKFSHDNSVKDKIIGLNQVSEFWGGVFDYTNPLLCTKRFQCITKLIADRKKIRDMDKIKGYLNNKKTYKYYNLSEKKNIVKKMPNIYTVANLIQKRKKEIKEEKLVEQMKKNKTEEQMRYFLNSLYE